MQSCYSIKKLVLPFDHYKIIKQIPAAKNLTLPIYMRIYKIVTSLCWLRTILKTGTANNNPIFIRTQIFINTVSYLITTQEWAICQK